MINTRITNIEKNNLFFFRLTTIIWLASCCTDSHSEILFISSWAQQNPLAVWQYLHTIDENRIQRMPDESSGGKWVARVEVRPGDKVGGWSGERAEVSGMLDLDKRALTVGQRSSHEYYGLSVKLDKNWQAPQMHNGNIWGTFFQLHGPDSLGSPPSIALMAEDKFALNYYAGDVTNLKKTQQIQFLDGSLQLGKRVEFMLDIKWAYDNKGALHIYRRNEGKEEWIKVLSMLDVPTLQYREGGSLGEHYWKAGFYRSDSLHTNVLYLGTIVRGTSWQEVVTAAFGKP